MLFGFLLDVANLLRNLLEAILVVLVLCLELCADGSAFDEIALCVSQLTLLPPCRDLVLRHGCTGNVKHSGNRETHQTRRRHCGAVAETLPLGNEKRRSSVFDFSNPESGTSFHDSMI